MRLHALSSQSDIIAITETWLSCFIHSNQICIPGYTIIHRYSSAHLRPRSKLFRVVTPSTETSSGRAGSRNPSDGHVSDSDSESDEPKDQNTGGGDADAGPNLVEQPPGIQPDSHSVNDLGLILRGPMTDNEVIPYGNFSPYSWSEVHFVNRPFQA